MVSSFGRLTTLVTSSVPNTSPTAIVLDASAAIEALIGSEVGRAVRARMRGCDLHAPAHLDAEILSALGRLHRAGALGQQLIARSLTELEAAPIAHHPLAGLLAGAWAARDRFRLVDGLYVELSRSLQTPLVTTDARLAQAYELAETITA
jgi:predicted nucleic acid-binding protein